MFMDYSPPPPHCEYTYLLQLLSGMHQLQLSYTSNLQVMPLKDGKEPGHLGRLLNMLVPLFRYSISGV